MRERRGRRSESCALHFRDPKEASRDRVRESSVFAELCLVSYKVGNVKKVRWAASRIGGEKGCRVL